MTRLYLIRHAEAEGNLYRIVQGQANSNLTDRGWRQVRALEKRFADVRIDAVYSSDLYRTCATASAIYRPKGLPLHRVPALREIGVGVWEQRTWGDIYHCDPEQMRFFGSRPDLWEVEGGEPPRQVQMRLLEAIRAIAAENDGKTVALFSHGYAIRLALARLQGYALEQLGQTPTGDNTAVSALDAENGDLRVVFRDDNSHLRTPEFLAGEKVRRRATALEPGLRFVPLAAAADAARGVLTEAGFDGEQRLEETDHALAGFLREEPVGLLRLAREAGRIAFVYIRPDHRKKGFGTQLIGQALLHARGCGSHTLLAQLPQGHSAEPFFADNGFVCTGTAGEERLWEKDIRFVPEFLGE